MLLDFDTLYQQYCMNVTGVLHIGAHYGEEHNVYTKYSSIQNIVYFEADEKNFAILQKNLKDEPKAILINKALGPFECRMDMYRETANQGQSNSLLKPKVHLQQYPGIQFPEKYELKVYPLDKFEPASHLNLINIDVQGFELEVLRGARKTLKNVDYIIAEVNRDELYEGCAHVDELDYFLARYGFKRVETNWSGQTWGDAMFLKHSI